MDTYNMKSSCFFRIFLFCAAWCISLLVPMRSSDAFTVPEHLEFDLTWSGIKAGTATLSISQDQETIRIVSTARSADWISLFYTVDDRVDSELRKVQGVLLGEPKAYRVKLREGRHRRNKEVIFDRKNGKARYTDFLKNEKKDFDISADAVDPLAGLYVIRQLDLTVGKDVYIDIFDSKKNWKIKVLVQRRERLSTVLGDVNTIVVRPLMQSEGIFSRSGDMEIWLTDDDRRIPVRMQTKVKIGSVTATLTKATFR